MTRNIYTGKVITLNVDTVQLPNGVMLMNTSTEKELLKFPATTIGETVASKRHLDGFQEGKVHGIRTLVTIKRELVPDPQWAPIAAQAWGRIIGGATLAQVAQ